MIIMVGNISVHDIEDLIIDVEYMKMGERTTICLIRTVMDMEFTGVVHSQNKDTYDYELGKKYSRQKAVDNMYSCGIIYLRSK